MARLEELNMHWQQVRLKNLSLQRMRSLPTNDHNDKIVLPTNSSERLINIVGVLGALIFTVLYLRVSQAIGRLGQDITYDDIGYVNDAVTRLDIAFRDGLFGYLKTFLENPPHSPFSTLLATCALIFGGYNDWTFYASNGLILIFVSLFLTRQFKWSRTPVVLWILAAFLTSPLAYRSIHDFRPDLALGFCTGAMIWWFIVGLRDGDTKAYIWSGITFGVALLIKPTFFAHTIALAICLLSVQFSLSTWLNVVGWNAAPQKTQNLARFFLTGLLLAAPYFVVNGKHIFDYFLSNVRGNNAVIWSYASDMPLFSLVKLYLSVPYQASIGFHFVLTLIFISALIYRRDLRSVFEIVFLLFFAIASFAIIVFGRHKNEFFFITFQFLLMLSAFVATAHLLTHLRKAAQMLTLMALWLALAFAVYSNQKSFYWQISAESAGGTWSWNSQIVKVIETDLIQRGWRQSSKQSFDVFVSIAGPVNSQTIMWTATKSGWRWNVFDTHMSGNLPEFLSAIAKAQYVILPNEVTSEYYRWLPSSSVQKELFQRISNDHKFKLVNFSADDPNYFVFVNSEVVVPNEPVIAVDGLLEISGFMDEEGPYAQWQLPRVRWMSNPNGKVCFRIPSAGTYDLALRFRPEIDGSLQVISSEEIFSQDFNGGIFKEANFPVSYPAGQGCIALKVSIGDTPDPARLLLFTKLKLKKLQ